MSGHSKWSTIKRQKAANDAKRGKIFTRLGREIMVAAREGGGDPDSNFALRLAVDRAKAANMPKDNIDRAIKRGTGELKDGASIDGVVYEAYGPHGIAMMLEVMTDNRNRSLSEIKSVLNKLGGTMAEPGAVAWQFEQKGYIGIASEGIDYDEVFLIAADAGAEDVTPSGEMIDVYTPRESLQAVQESLENAGITSETANLEWVANMPIDLEPQDAKKVMQIIEQLEDLDDMQNVFTNLNITDEVVASYEGVT